MMLLPFIRLFFSLIRSVQGLRNSQFAGGSTSCSRGYFLQYAGGGVLSSSVVFTSITQEKTSHPEQLQVPPFIQHPFEYSAQWTGTALPRLTLTNAVVGQKQTTEAGSLRWPMGRWPDPVLRQSSDPVEEAMLGTEILQQACDCLRNTAVAEKAVGLAAQQCGVNARIVYLQLAEEPQRSNSYLNMINPRIIGRSSEMEMRVWREDCLVLPPTFQATVLRDSWVNVEYQDWTSNVWRTVHLEGETARAVQHEMDHDRGILVTDHVGLEELENDFMRAIERPGHETRMALAYTRYFYNS